jgi:NAD(P)-dependent dehydrogenase (short-subunit alcohol dehydrogenase family)
MDDARLPDDGRPVVLVTGASSGIGRAAAIAFARRMDAHLVLAARREPELRETADHAGAQTTTLVPVDLTDPADVDRLAQRVLDLGRLDVLVNNAGVGSSRPFDHPDAMQDADRILALNLRTPIALTHALTPLLRRSRGTIINISSVAGLVGTPEADVYSASKWALTGFSEASRARLARDGVRVVCIQPGPVPTPGWPHARIGTMPVARHLLASDVDTIAADCIRAAQGRGSVAPVRPRTYLAVPWLRVLAPWLLRALLVRAGRRRARSFATPTAGERSTT